MLICNYVCILLLHIDTHSPQLQKNEDVAQWCHSLHDFPRKFPGEAQGTPAPFEESLGRS